MFIVKGIATIRKIIKKKNGLSATINILRTTISHTSVSIYTHTGSYMGLCTSTLYQRNGFYCHSFLPPLPSPQPGVCLSLHPSELIPSNNIQLCIWYALPHNKPPHTEWHKTQSF